MTMENKENENKVNNIKPEYQVFLGPLQEESELIKKIKDNYLFFILISIIFGGICTISFYKNQSGINALFFAITWIVCSVVAINKLGIKISKISYLYMLGIIMFSISTMFTTSTFSIVLNGASILLLITMMLQWNFYDTGNWQFGSFFIGTCNMISRTISHCLDPFTHFSFYREAKTKKESKLRYVMIGISISIPLVLVVLVLLISADSIFSSIFKNIFEDINFVDIFGISFVFCLGSIGFYAVLAGLSAKKDKNEVKDLRKGEPIIAITFTSILTVIYLVFCLIQIKYLFIGGANALPEGLTYSEYARKGFFQLVFVSIINLGLVLICIRIFKESKVLKVVLLAISACTYIMIASSAYRMIIYVGEYQLTFLRILVLWFLVLLTVLMTGIIYAIYNESFNFFRFSIISILSFYLVFSFAKVDRIIAEYNVSHIDTLTSSDVLYMVQELSYDAAPVISRIHLSEVDMSDVSEMNAEENLRDMVNNYFETIEKDYDKRGIRGFNFSSFAADKAAQIIKGN